MHKLFITLSLSFLLSACNTLSDWNLSSAFSNSNKDSKLASNTSLEQYNFDWQLSGERSIAPMQVFDDGNKTWLQFMPGQNTPAIFSVKTDLNTLLVRESPVYFTRNSDYIILDGVWDQLVFRGGLLKAKAEKISNVTVSKDKKLDLLAINKTEQLDNTKSSEPKNNYAKPEKLAIKINPEPKNKLKHTELSQKTETHPVKLTSDSFNKVKSLFKVSPADSNIRLALQRWAKLADWTFMPEHWSVDVDIPISAQASFTSSFQESVQDLVGATEMAERPLQPCFYSNKVLRVIPYTQSCNRAYRG